MPNSQFLQTISYTADHQKQTINSGDLRIPKGMQAKGLELRITLPLINNSSANYGKAVLAALLAYALKTFTLGFGKEGKALKLWDSEIGSNLLLAHRWCYGNTPGASSSLGTTSGVFGSTGLAKSGAAQDIVTMYVRVPFENWRMNDRRKLAIGASQFGTIYIDNTNGIASDLVVGGLGTLALDGTMSIDIYANVTEGADVLSPGIAFSKNSRQGLYCRLARALPLVLAENTVVGYANAVIDQIDINVGSFQAKGDRIASINDYHEDTLQGNSDLTDVWTILAEQEPLTDFLHLPSGDIEVKQPNTTAQAGLSLVALVVPPLDAGTRAGLMAEIGPMLKAPSHLANAAATTKNPGVPVRNLDFSRVRLSVPGEPEYDAHAGEAYDAAGRKQGTYIPPPGNAGAKGLAATSAAAVIPGSLSNAASAAVQGSTVQH